MADRWAPKDSNLHTSVSGRFEAAVPPTVLPLDEKPEETQESERSIVLAIEFRRKTPHSLLAGVLGFAPRLFT